MGYWERRLRYNNQLWKITKFVIGTLIVINGVYKTIEFVSDGFNEHIEKQLDRQSQEKRIERMKEESEEWMNRENKFYDTEYKKEKEPNEWYLKENKEQKEKETREWDSKSSSF